jgi:hypothetical protein
MNLAWKILLPLGLVNFVAVAVMLEYGESLSEQFGAAVYAGFAVFGWLVLIGAWVVAAVLSPSHDDNLPRRHAEEFDPESEMFRTAQNPLT